MAVADPIVGTIRVLEASSRIPEHGFGEVWFAGGEIPAHHVKKKGLLGVVIASAGAPGMAPGTADNLPVSVERIDVRCYGRTRNEADTLARVVTRELKAWKYGSIDRHLIHWYRRVSGPVPLRDPDGDWPVAIVTLLVQLADDRVPV